MPPDDAIKAAVVAALRKAGWVITSDPLAQDFEEVGVLIDLAAERADEPNRRIAVEVKTFAGGSVVRDIRDALGQYEMYSMILEESDPGRTLYLAVSDEVYRDVFGLTAVRMFQRKRPMRLLVVRVDTEEVTTWTD